METISTVTFGHQANGLSNPENNDFEDAYDSDCGKRTLTEIFTPYSSQD